MKDQERSPETKSPHEGFWRLIAFYLYLLYERLLVSTGIIPPDHASYEEMDDSSTEIDTFQNIYQQLLEIVPPYLTQFSNLTKPDSEEPNIVDSHVFDVFFMQLQNMNVQLAKPHAIETWLDIPEMPLLREWVKTGIDRIATIEREDPEGIQADSARLAFLSMLDELFRPLVADWAQLEVIGYTVDSLHVILKYPPLTPELTEDEFYQGDTVLYSKKAFSSFFFNERARKYPRQLKFTVQYIPSDEEVMRYTDQIPFIQERIKIPLAELQAQLQTLNTLFGSEIMSVAITKSALTFILNQRISQNRDEADRLAATKLTTVPIEYERALSRFHSALIEQSLFIYDFRSSIGHTS
jgi:hypothetical protein